MNKPFTWFDQTSLFALGGVYEINLHICWSGFQIMFSSEVIAFLNNYKMLENQVAHGKTENKRVSDMITNNQSKPSLLYTQRWI